jgi:hypothetical protein
MVSLFCLFGGAEGDRTPGLMTASHALSQLSYSPNFQKLIIAAKKMVSILFFRNKFS